MLSLSLLSNGRVSITCDSGGGECRGSAAEIANFMMFCRVNRKLKQRVHGRVGNAEFDIFPAVNSAESKFYPKSYQGGSL